MKKFNVYLSAIILSLCTVLTGCRSPKMPATPAQQGAVVGGLAGGGAGALWAQHAHVSTINSWQGAGAGVVAGALAGALIGDALDEYAYDNAAGLKDKEMMIDDLQRQLSAAEQELLRLRNKPGLENVQVESVGGQLRFTILSEVLFAPGKADLIQSSKTTLDSVLTVIEQEYPDREISVEGHTDSDPILRSAWKDNWELSYNRSMAVVYYCIHERLVAPERLRAVACGEFHPVASNATPEGKRVNRRAVIVVMPSKDAIVIEKK
jgi:flagellar motor protein MotB